MRPTHEYVYPYLRGRVVTRSKLRFRPEIVLPPAGLTETVRSLDARLRSTEPAQLTRREAQALNDLLRTVNQLTEPSRFGSD